MGHTPAAMPDDPSMSKSLKRRLQMVFQRSGDPDGPSDDAETESPAAQDVLPLVDFVAYATDCILSGRVRLAADRLTDMLNQHDEIELVDVMVERLDGLGVVEVRKVLVLREEILLVHATGPRGSHARRHRTRQHPLAMKLGPYEVRGNLHALPGTDPLLAIRRRRPMVPLTDAWIEYVSGSEHERRRVAALVVNRDQIDVIEHALDEAVELPEMPIPGDPGPLVKDFTGHILGRSSGS
jgi:hypothetical protein